MREEVDKLAWGLVKEEIRNLMKPRADEKIEKIFSDTIRPPGGGFYKGSLNEAKQKAVRRQVLSRLQDQLRGFQHESYKARLAEEGSTTIHDTMFFWDHNKLLVNETGNPQKRVEQYINLKHTSFAVGKKKLVADFIDSFVLINEHTLYRMIQRGLVHREPLRHIQENLDELLQYAAIFLLTHHLVGDELGHNIFIPFGKGAFLAKMTFTQTTESKWGWGMHNMRFIDGIKGGKIEPSPWTHMTETEFDGKQGVSSLQIATWIPETYFHSEQWWAKYRIEEFMAKYQQAARFSRVAFTAGSRLVSGEESKRIKDESEAFGMALNKVIHDRRWAIACNW